MDFVNSIIHSFTFSTSVWFRYSSVNIDIKWSLGHTINSTFPCARGRYYRIRFGMSLIFYTLSILSSNRFLFKMRVFSRNLYNAFFIVFFAIIYLCDLFSLNKRCKLKYWGKHLFIKSDSYDNVVKSIFKYSGLHHTLI